MSIPVVILAGGKNTRIDPFGTNRHKGLITLFGSSLIDRTAKDLIINGFTEIYVVLSQRDFTNTELRDKLVQDNPNANIHFVLQEEALGMGNALLQVKEYISGRFFVVFPYHFDVSAALLSMENDAYDGTICYSHTPEPWNYGIVTVEGEQAHTITEKPQQHLNLGNKRIVGIYLLNQHFLSILERTPQGEYCFENALQSFLSSYKVRAIEIAEEVLTLKYPWHLFNFQRHLFAKLPRYISPYASVAKTAFLDETAGPIYIENGASVGHCVKIVGPCYIGRNVFIGDFSLIRQSSFEEGASVGVHSDVTRSILMEDSSMHTGFIGDSILGRNVKIGAGFITSNQRLDRNTVAVTVKEKVVDTRLQRLGTIIGDDANIGVRVSIMPGKVIGARAVVYPGTIIWESVPHDATVKTKMDVEVF